MQPLLKLPSVTTIPSLRYLIHWDVILLHVHVLWAMHDCQIVWIIRIKSAAIKAFMGNLQECTPVIHLKPWEWAYFSALPVLVKRWSIWSIKSINSNGFALDFVTFLPKSIKHGLIGSGHIPGSLCWSLEDVSTEGLLKGHAC